MADSSGTPPVVRKSPLPRYMAWRDGRPRWIPGPRLRALGHKGRDLKKPDGSWMTLGQAVDAADKINDAVDKSLPLETPAAERTLNALFDLYEASPNFTNLAPRTQDDYRQEMKTLRAWAGDTPVTALKRTDFKTLQAELTEKRSQTRSNAIMRVARLTMNFAVDELEWTDKNRAAKLKMKSVAGRLVVWTPEEIKTFVAAADYAGLESAGDAVMMGLCLGQNEADILACPPLRIEEGVYRMTRGKNGRVAYIPPVMALVDRLNLAHLRLARKYPNVRFATELVSTERGTSYPAEATFFQQEHLYVRKLAAGVIFAEEDAADRAAGRPVKLRNLPFTPMPSIMDKRFQDLRDTAVTVIYSFTKDIARTATITGHSLKTAQQIIDKHYFVRSAGLALEATGCFDAFLASSKIGA